MLYWKDSVDLPKHQGSHKDRPQGNLTAQFRQVLSYIPDYMGVLKIVDPQVTMGLFIHVNGLCLDDLGLPPWLRKPPDVDVDELVSIDYLPSKTSIYMSLWHSHMLTRFSHHMFIFPNIFTWYSPISYMLPSCSHIPLYFPTSST